MLAHGKAERPELLGVRGEEDVEPRVRCDPRPPEVDPDPVQVIDRVGVGAVDVSHLLVVPQQEPEQHLAVVDAEHLLFVNAEVGTGLVRERDRAVVGEDRGVGPERLGVLEADQLLVGQVQGVARMTEVADHEAAPRLARDPEEPLPLAVLKGAAHPLLDPGPVRADKPGDPPTVLLGGLGRGVGLGQEGALRVDQPVFRALRLRRKESQQSAHRAQHPGPIDKAPRGEVETLVRL